jgi:hypothetical protein
MVALTRIRNNQVYNSDINAQYKLQPYSVTGGLLSNNFTYTGNMTIGNLVVNGVTTTIDTTNLVVADPLLAINRNQSGSPSYDLGFVMGRGNQTNVAMIWEENAQQFQLQYTTESTAATTFGTINNSGFANLQAYGVSLNNATIGTSTVTNFVGSNVSISGGTINNTTIGATTPNSGVFTSVTTSAGGQLSGYLTGAIGANGANSGQFTTLTTTSGAAFNSNATLTTDQANVTLFNLSSTTINLGGAATAVNIGAATGTTTVANNLKAASFIASGGGNIAGYLNGALGANTPNSVVATSVTTSAGGQLSGYFTGAIGANTANSGAFTTVTTSGTLVSQGTITGAGQVIGYFNGVIGANVANSGVFTTANVNGTLYAANVNAGTIGNSGAALTASTATLTGTANSYGSGQGALQISGGFYAGGDSYITGNLSITGNLTSVGYNELIANAPLLYLSVGSISTYNYELGFYSHKYDAIEGYNHTGLVRNHLDNAWFLFSNIRTEPTNTVDLANASIIYDTLKLGNIIAYSGNTSTSTTTGAAVIYGGMGVGGNIYAAAIQGTPIGNGVASTGAFTTLTATTNITAQTSNVYAAYVVGNTALQGLISTNAQPYITSVGTLSGLVSSGNITAQTANVYAAYVVGNTALQGLISTNAQPYITSVGTLTSLTSSGNVNALNFNGGNAATVGNLIANGGISSTSTGTGSLIIVGGAGVSGNLNVGANSYITSTENVPTVYSSNIYPYANSGNINLYTASNSNLTVNANQLVANLVVHGNSAAGYQNLLVTNGATGQVGIKIAPNAIVSNVSLQINSTDAMIVPVGAQSQRPSNAQQGMLRYNTNNSQLEFYNGAYWTGTGSVFTIISADQFTGNGSATSFTLSQSTTTNGVIVSINGVVQIPTTAYTVSGTTLTFTEAPLSTDIIDARAITTTSSVTSITDASGANTVVANTAGVYTTALNSVSYLANSSGNFFGGGISTLSANTSLSAGVPTVIDSFSTTTYRGAKYVVTLSDYSNYNFTMAEVILVCGNSNASVQTYGVVSANGTSIGNFYANVSGTTAKLYANAGVSSYAKVQQIYMPL